MLVKALILIFFLSFSSAQRLEAKQRILWPENIDWYTSLSQARALSLKKDLPVFAVIYADWCPACHKLSQYFADKDISILSKNYLMLKVNADKNKQDLQSFFGSVRQIPQVFVFDAYSLRAEKRNSLVSPTIRQLKSFMIKMRKKKARSIKENARQTSIENPKLLCAKGNASFCGEYGKKMLEKNKMNKARAYFDKACKMKHLESCYELALIQLSIESFDLGNEVLKDACSQKHIKSCQLLREMKKADEDD